MWASDCECLFAQNVQTLGPLGRPSFALQSLSCQRETVVLFWVALKTCKYFCSERKKSQKDSKCFCLLRFGGTHSRHSRTSNQSDGKTLADTIVFYNVEIFCKAKFFPNSSTNPINWLYSFTTVGQETCVRVFDCLSYRSFARSEFLPIYELTSVTALLSHHFVATRVPESILKTFSSHVPRPCDRIHLSLLNC